MIKHIFFGLCFLNILIACDKIKPPFIEQNNKCGNDTLSVSIRKILLEEFTGHKCGNCPQAAEKIEELKTIYCAHIVPVCIHYGFFAKADVSGNYTYNYTTSDGNAIGDFYSISSVPTGLINRTTYNGNSLIDYQIWATVIDQLLQKPPDINIKISNTYDNTSRNVSTTININFINAMNRNLNLVTALIEDSIVSYQKDYRLTPNDIPNYAHNHVYRGTINNMPWGEIISSSSISVNHTIEKKYSFTLDTIYNVSKCSILAYVIDDASKEVIQAELKKIIK